MPWAELDAELNMWRAAGREASMWVRDDDAQGMGNALQKLIDICGRAGVPLALAVIPAGTDETLSDAVNAAPKVHVLQHGWSHTNHAGPDEKKCELGDHRPVDVVFGELGPGRTRLEALFGGRFLPVMVPPWNRIGEDVASHLDAHGYSGLSTFGPRGRSMAATGLIRVNTHVDVFDWRGTRAFRGDDTVLAQAVAHLKARRLGQVDGDEPTGLITHHLIHDEGCWGFIERYLQHCAGHPAVRWLAASEIFAQAKSIV